MLCIPSRPSRASKEDIPGEPPQHIFIFAKQALELSHEPSLQLPVLDVHGSRVLAYARAALRTRSSAALEVLQAQPQTEGQLGFLGQQVSLRCLRPLFRANIEGQFVVG